MDKIVVIFIIITTIQCVNANFFKNMWYFKEDIPTEPFEAPTDIQLIITLMKKVAWDVFNSMKMCMMIHTTAIITIIFSLICLHNS